MPRTRSSYNTQLKKNRVNIINYKLSDKKYEIPFTDKKGKKDINIYVDPYKEHKNRSLNNKKYDLCGQKLFKKSSIQIIFYTYVVGTNKNLPSSEARYQEVEITEDDLIYDILRKMDRLYLLLYKVTIQLAPNNKFNPKETITTTTELNAWDKCNRWGTHFESQCRDNEISYATGSLILDNQIRPETLFRWAIQAGWMVAY
ncbi:15720_t:CDS:2 [Dentiscutata heterogama]|uniref:15720_t:CDS:1 n=1 Tax=Dentiscutata heterogama TaxID=1316150 RepID=A0ACA9K0C5_9GLOM|nr:15720_t:CDS:2 [Dentiscutata heterogama]